MIAVALPTVKLSARSLQTRSVRPDIFFETQMLSPTDALCQLYCACYPPIKDGPLNRCDTRIPSSDFCLHSFRQEVIDECSAGNEHELCVLKIQIRFVHQSVANPLGVAGVPYILANACSSAGCNPICCLICFRAASRSPFLLPIKSLHPDSTALMDSFTEFR